MDGTELGSLGREGVHVGRDQGKGGGGERGVEFWRRGAYGGVLDGARKKSPFLPVLGTYEEYLA